jgi:hypothetical protein
MKCVLNKHEGWKYEQEQRIVVPLGARSYLPFRPQALTAVILGCRAPNSVADCVVSMLRERKARGMPASRIYSAAKHAARYRLLLRRRRDLEEAVGQ